MTCQDIDNLLQDFIDDELSPSDYERVTAHHQSCADCSQKYQQALSVISILQNFDVTPSTPDFADRVIAQAFAGQQNTKRIPRRVPAAIAASFVLIALISVILNLKFPTQNDVVVLNGDEITVIKVAIDSAQAIDGVSMSIDLSDNLQISGYENLKELSWKANLSKGTNVIALPISALARGDGEITAQVRVNDSVRIFIVKTRNQSLDKVRKSDKNFMNAFNQFKTQEYLS